LYCDLFGRDGGASIGGDKMGWRYMIDGFDYPYKGYRENCKHTTSFIVALFWFVVYTSRYDGVNFTKRR
jgi:hypothetical protein